MAVRTKLAMKSCPDCTQTSSRGRARPNPPSLAEVAGQANVAQGPVILRYTFADYVRWVIARATTDDPLARTVLTAITPLFPDGRSLSDHREP